MHIHRHKFLSTCRHILKRRNNYSSVCHEFIYYYIISLDLLVNFINENLNNGYRGRFKNIP